MFLSQEIAAGFLGLDLVSEGLDLVSEPLLNQAWWPGMLAANLAMASLLCRAAGRGYLAGWVVGASENPAYDESDESDEK